MTGWGSGGERSSYSRFADSAWTYSTTRIPTHSPEFSHFCRDFKHPRSPFLHHPNESVGSDCVSRIWRIFSSRSGVIVIVTTPRCRLVVAFLSARVIEDSPAASANCRNASLTTMKDFLG